LAAGLALWAAPARGAELAQTIEQIEPSVVAVGTLRKTRSPSIRFVDTGFVVADRRHIIASAYVVFQPARYEKTKPISCSFSGARVAGA
jgi:hypothetical protein